MRNFLHAAGVAALAMTIWSGADRAFGFQVSVGGLAGECSSNAKKGLHDAHALEICTLALNEPSLNAHDRAGTYVNRGAIEVLNRDWEEAREDFSQALRIKPDMGEAHIGQGAYLISMERWPEAEAEVSRGLDLGSEEPEKGYYFRGLARWGQENFKGAYFDFRKASELKPSWPLPRQQLVNFKVTPVG
jgi:tetratricopeptide (TPR) repeat protein